MLFAFSRDHGVPGLAAGCARSRTAIRTPANAIVAIVVFSYLLTNAAFIAGGCDGHRDRHGDQHDRPLLGLRRADLPGASSASRSGGTTPSGSWAASRGRSPSLACLWIALISVLFLWPTSGNPWTLIAYAVFLGFLLVYYFAWARRRFKGPIVEVGEEELTEIEREFEHAAEELGGATA